MSFSEHHYARVHWPPLLGDYREVVGPYSTVMERRKAINALRSHYPQGLISVELFSEPRQNEEVA